MGSFTVQNTIDGCSQDVRRILDSTNAGDQVALIDYTNRIQLQLLREARWRFLLSGVLQFTTTPFTGIGPFNGNDYWIGATGTGPTSAVDTSLNLTNVGVVKSGTVFDRTNFKRLNTTDEAPLGPDFSNPSQPTAINSRPRLYRNDQITPGIFSIYPSSDKAYTVEFRYFFQKPQLTALANVLLIPDDYKDVVIAGVNWLASAYLRENKQDAQFWQQLYEVGIQGMHRDHNLFPRGQEFIAPDPASTPRTVTTPIGLDSGIESSLP